MAAESLSGNASSAEDPEVITLMCRFEDTCEQTHNPARRWGRYSKPPAISTVWPHWVSSVDGPGRVEDRISAQGYPVATWPQYSPGRHGLA
jgi:hypothetical protein